MKKIILSLLAMLFCVPAMLHPQPTGGEQAPPRKAAAPMPGKKGAEATADGTGGSSPRNINLDAMFLYGQYNRLVWLGSLTQSIDAFSYQLNSQFNRSNDFGYRHSGYYDNTFGFTGEAAPTEKWRLTPEVEVKNESRGMFRNVFYNREEKDRVGVKFKSDYKPMPTRWILNIGGVYFTHRLDATQTPDWLTLKPYHSSDFYKINAEFGWEYIWSAANKLSFNSTFSYYFFRQPYDFDSWVANELMWNFNITEHFKFSLGPRYTYNQDRGHFPSGKIEVATANIRYFSVGASYVYELVPFTPEQLYYDQRYVKPEYNLLPGKGHHAEYYMGFDMNINGTKPFHVKKLKIKGTGTYVTNDRFYAFYSLPEQVLKTHRMKLEQIRARGEAAIGFAFYSAYCELGGKYEYTYSYASDYVTYQPVHAGQGYARLSVYRFESEFSTGYRDRVHSSPFCPRTLKPALIGSLSLQIKVVESFFLFGRIDNIYNSKYSTVSGYPEQGRSVVGGVRIIL